MACSSTVAAAFVLAALVAPARALGQDTTVIIPSEGPHGFLFKEPSVTLGIHGSFDLRRAQSSIYQFFINQFTLSKSDFSAFGVGGEIGVRIASPLDIVMGGDYTRTSKLSESRDYVDQNNLPITQRTTLWTVPLSVALRWYPTARGREIGRFVWIPARVTPYVGLGGGAVHYSLTQAGSFVDSQLSIFDAKYQSDGWAPLALVTAGVDYGLGTLVFLNADVRYLWANAGVQQDFKNFPDGIDLNGVAFSIGLHLRLEGAGRRRR
jgi:hypothetical protein